MNSFSTNTRRSEAFFSDLEKRKDRAYKLYDSEQWRREFLISPVMTSPCGLGYFPMDIGCEVSYPLPVTIRNKIKDTYGKDLARVRPDYIVFPKTQDLVQLVVEAKKSLDPNSPINLHRTQVLIEQAVSKAHWAILTDGSVWVLFSLGRPLFCCKSLNELSKQMPLWRSLVSREALRQQGGDNPELLRLLLTAGHTLPGLEPDADLRSELESDFPGLRNQSFLVLAEPSSQYNCYGAVVGDRGRWWQPDTMGYAYWPKGAPRNYSLNGYKECLQYLGYAECTHEAKEVGVRKIAIFVKNNQHTHVALQTSEGLWISKVWQMNEIIHNLFDLEGESFGSPEAIFAVQTEDEDS